MAKLGIHGVRARAVELLQAAGGSMRTRDLVRQIAGEHPETMLATVQTQVSCLPTSLSGVVRVSPGVLALRGGGVVSVEARAPRVKTSKVKAPPILLQPVQVLLDLGFVLVGRWELKGEKPTYTLDLHAERKDILYSFVVDGTVMYIGKSARTLGKRIYGYQTFGPSQITNVKNNGHIRAALVEGRTVEIFALVDWEPVFHCGIPVNVAAGIEDALIARLGPPWNGREGVGR